MKPLAQEPVCEEAVLASVDLVAQKANLLVLAEHEDGPDQGNYI